jgi:tRNA nucleotidyltransferase/poly(A) polymerase
MVLLGTVGLAEDRFGEDRLRILRAIRFAARVWK